MRASVSIPRSPTSTTRERAKRWRSFSMWTPTVLGSAVLPSNTSTATGHPSRCTAIRTRFGACRAGRRASSHAWPVDSIALQSKWKSGRRAPARRRSSGVGPDASRWCLGARAASPWRRRARLRRRSDAGGEGVARGVGGEPARGGELREDAAIRAWCVRVRARRWRRGCGRGAACAALRTAATWPASAGGGEARRRRAVSRILNPSTTSATSTEGAFTDLAGLAIGFAQQDGGRGVLVDSMYMAEPLTSGEPDVATHSYCAIQ